MSHNPATVAVIGGDARQAAAARRLAYKGYGVRLCGLPDDGQGAGRGRCQSPGEAMAGAAAVLLPLAELGPDGRVATAAEPADLFLSPADIGRLAPAAVFFVGSLAARWLNLCRLHGIRVVEYRERDDFALLNAVPSAEGAIQLAMTASPLTIWGSRAVVVGYGRTGSVLARTLGGLGARVWVAARDSADLARCRTAGHLPLPWRRLGHGLARADLIFNTVPALVLDAAVLGRVKRRAVIIDLASAPGGTDFAAAAARGLKAILAPGLPGRVAPETAGRIVADLVIAQLHGVFGQEENES